MTSPTKTFLRNEQMVSKCTASILMRNGEPSSSKRNSQTDARIKKIFAWLQSNRCTDEENFCTDAVKRIYGWWLTEIFERMQSNDVKPSDANECNFFCTDSPGRSNDWAAQSVRIANAWHTNGYPLETANHKERFYFRGVLSCYL